MRATSAEASGADQDAHPSAGAVGDLLRACCAAACLSRRARFVWWPGGALIAIIVTHRSSARFPPRASTIGTSTRPRPSHDDLDADTPTTPVDAQPPPKIGSTVTATREAREDG